VILVAFGAWIWVGWTRELAGIPFYRRALVYFGGFALAVTVFHVLASPAMAMAGSRLGGEVAAGTVAFSLYALWLWKLHPDTMANVEYAFRLLGPR
jgi:hypothetical protein